MVPFVAPLYLLPLCKTPVAGVRTMVMVAVQLYGMESLVWLVMHVCAGVPCTACVISEKQTGWNSACPCVRASVIRTLDLTRAHTGQLV